MLKGEPPNSTFPSAPAVAHPPLHLSTHRVWDLVVAGAGPTGSSAAYYAARQGLSVLCLEQRPTIGHPVQCGEFVPEVEELATLFPRTPDIEHLFHIPLELKCTTMSTCRLVTPQGVRIPVPFRGYSTNRTAFDQYLWGRAESAGAKLLTRVKVTGIAHHRKEILVRTSKGEFRASVVVLATGSLTPAMRWLGYSQPAENCPCIYTIAQFENDRQLDFYFGRIAPGGYAWVIPKDAISANIGLGIQPSFLATCGNLRELLIAFLGRIGADIGSARRFIGGWVPMGGPVRSAVCGNVMVAGDAAGMVMPTNGGGIPSGMIAGLLAGCTAVDHLHSGTPIRAFDQRWRDVLGRALTRSTWTRRIVDLALPWDSLVTAGMNFLGPKGMDHVVVCRPFRSGRPDRARMKRPVVQCLS